MIYFISDTHFNHKNILEYEHRPFSSIEEHDNLIINNWNQVVKPDDTVFHLGDFCFGDNEQAKEYFLRLNGHIYLIYNRFHHDRHWKKQDIYWGKSNHLVYFLEPIYLFTHNEKILILSHYPQYIWDRKHYGSWHLFGHSQIDSIPDSIFCMNVSVTKIKYCPISFDEVEEIMIKKGEQNE